MKRAVEAVAAGDWPAAAAADSVTLAFDDRHRRRYRLATDRGDDLLLDLPRAAAMSDGDGLRLETGGWVRVTAAAEPVMVVRGRDPQHLLRLAWHIGNRHLPAQLLRDRIVLRPDHVIAAMLRGLGARVDDTTAPFQPEGGAYDHGGGDGHGHNH
jgi:urease accessory protein